MHKGNGKSCRINPLQQGLRLWKKCAYKCFVDNLQNQSITTRIKTIRQGQKARRWLYACRINPLQQGLRRLFCDKQSKIVWYLQNQSITTRIKTDTKKIFTIFHDLQNQSITTRIKTQRICGHMRTQKPLQNQSITTRIKTQATPKSNYEFS